MPELCASPDGGISFEWAAGKKILSVSLYESIIVYAQLIDESKQHGEMKFTGEIPDAISGMLLKFFPVVS